MSQTARWAITLFLTEFLEPMQMTVFSAEEGDGRTICRMDLGPFDDPTEVLGQVIELIDQAVWSGKPVQLPISAGE